MIRNIKILHITNHSGTTLNANQIATYINNSNPKTNPKPNSNSNNIYNLSIQITTKPWQYHHYINSAQANTIFEEWQKQIELNTYDILLFTDTIMYGRPFLQNIDKHPCQIILYITNRFDWGIWNITDPDFYKLYSSKSRNNRVICITDNRYDKYYAEIKGNIHFPLEDYVRLTPYISPILHISANYTNKFKLLIQNRGTDINHYKPMLDSYGIQYDVFDSVKRYRDKEHICEYLGILHLPYQVNIQSLWENLGYGIIHFIPSKRFILELLENTNWYYWEEHNKKTSNCKQLFAKSIDYSEWYSQDLNDCFIYFDNWNDLYYKYFSICSTTPETEYPKWYITKRQNIIEKASTNNQITINKWMDIFNRLIRQKPTIVSMFYNIRAMDGDVCDYHRKQDQFYSLAKQFILKLNMPLFLCMDVDNVELIKLIKEVRAENGYEDITYFHFEKFEETYFYQYMENIRDAQSKYPIYNGNPRHETPRYITLNNNKFHFMDKAITINPFSSDKFIWLDMGINHVAQKPFKILNWQFDIPDKIKHLCINPYLEDTQPKELFHNIYHHIAGGLFSGSLEYLSIYIEHYKKKIKQILDEGWYQIDEAIMTIIQRENPTMFEFYYGDYDGIIANYKEAEFSMNLIMTTINKTIHFNVFEQTFKILQYLVPYFQMEDNQYSGHFYQFIQYNIIVSHINNNCLMDSVIELINKKIQTGDTRIKALLETYSNKIQIYNNKDRIFYHNHIL